MLGEAPANGNASQHTDTKNLLNMDAQECNFRKTKITLYIFPVDIL